MIGLVKGSRLRASDALLPPLRRTISELAGEVKTMAVRCFEGSSASAQHIDGQKKVEQGSAQHDRSGFVGSLEEWDDQELERLALVRLGGVCHFEQEEK